MYIKLNSLEVNSSRIQKDDWMVLSQVIDSGVSYERPVIVRSVEELEIWFGKNFEDYEYFRELIECGVVLYLTKPVSLEFDKNIKDYINYEEYPIKIDPKTQKEILYYTYSDLPNPGKEGVRYKLVSSNGGYKDKGTNLPIDYLIWYGSNYVSIDNLPQNLEQNDTVSDLNRDTLRIFTNSSNLNFQESFPEYSKDGLDFEDDNRQELKIVETEYYSWQLQFDELFLQFPQFDPENNNVTNNYYQAPYIAVTDSNGNLNVLFYGFGTKYLPPLKTSFESIGFPSNKVKLIDLNRDSRYRAFSWNINDLGSDIAVKIISAIPLAVPDIESDSLGVGLTARLFSNRKFKVYTNISIDKDYYGESNVSLYPISSVINTINESNLRSYLEGQDAIKFRLSFPGNDNISNMIECPYLTFPNKEGRLFVFYYEIPNSSLPTVSMNNTKLVSLNDLGYSWEDDGYIGIIKGAVQYLKYNNANRAEVTYEILENNVFKLVSTYSVSSSSVICNIPESSVQTITILSDLPTSTMSDLLEGYSTLKLKIDFSTDFLTYPNFYPPKVDEISGSYEYPFVAVPRVDGKFAIFYYKTTFSGLTGFIGGDREGSSLSGCSDIISDYITVPWSRSSTGRDNVTSLIKSIQEYLNSPKVSNNIVVGFKTIDYRTVELLSSYPIRYSLFTNIPESLMSTSAGETSSKSLGKLSKICKKFAGIEFTSKTIGNSGDGNDIKVLLENILPGYARLTISKYGYSEVFEGPLSDVLGKERLDFTVSRESKLVRCSIFSEDIPDGSWYLKGSSREISSREGYWKAFKNLMSEDNSYLIDYFLIPNIYHYIKDHSNDLSYYPEYKDFLSISEENGCTCQFLIQNLDNKYKLVECDELPQSPSDNIVYKLKSNYYILNPISNLLEETKDQSIINNKGDYIYNYLDDKNRLIYFFRTMTYNTMTRPGYYLFLRSLFAGTYSYSTSIVNYNCPSTLPYSASNLELELSKYKSNYLTDNNHQYYYENFQNGTDFLTSIWMRFCIGKIHRELEKRKGSYLALSNQSEIRITILNIFNLIVESFSIVKSITLKEFNIDLQKNQLRMTIDTAVNDLINNDIILDMTVNYNK